MLPRYRGDTERLKAREESHSAEVFEQHIT